MMYDGAANESPCGEEAERGPTGATSATVATAMMGTVSKVMSSTTSSTGLGRVVRRERDHQHHCDDYDRNGLPHNPFPSLFLLG